MRFALILMLILWTECTSSSKKEDVDIFLIKEIPVSKQNTIKNIIMNYLKDTLLHPETMKDFEYSGFDTVFTSISDDSSYITEFNSFKAVRDSFDIVTKRLKEYDPIYRPYLQYVTDTSLLNNRLLAMQQIGSTMETIASSYKKTFKGWYINVKFKVNNIHEQETTNWVTFCFDPNYSNVIGFYKGFKTFKN